MKRRLLGALVIGAAVSILLWLGRSGGRSDPRAAHHGELPPARAQLGPGVARTMELRRAIPTAGRDAERQLRLEGQILGPDGAGVAGAQVSLTTEPPSVVASDADGSFAFEHLSSGTYAVAATAGELIGGPVVFRLTAQRDPLIVRLGRGAALAVRVVDERGQPVAAAEVELVEATARTVATDETGRAMFRPLHIGSAAVTVSATGYATATAIAAVRSAGETAELAVTLHPGFAVSGRVIDERGQPLAGAEVSLAEAIGGAGSGVRVATDGAGRFTLTGLAPGTHRLLASHGEHAPAESPPTAIIDRSVTGVQITMPAGAVVAGIVTATDAAPIGSATVRLVGRDGTSERTVVRETTSDERGRFEVRGLPRIALQTQAESDRGTSAVLEVDLTRAVSAVEVALVLDAGESISGAVVDGKGVAMSEVQVTALRDSTSAADGRTEFVAPTTTTTDGAGGFSIRGLRAGAYRLFATTGDPTLRNPGGGVRAMTGAKDVRLALIPADAAREAMAGQRPEE